MPDEITIQDLIDKVKADLLAPFDAAKASKEELYGIGAVAIRRAAPEEVDLIAMDEPLPAAEGPLTAIEVHQHRLDNGLRVVLTPDRSIPTGPPTRKKPMR